MASRNSISDKRRLLVRHHAEFLSAQLPPDPLEEKLVSNWRALAECDRGRIYRKVEALAMLARDPVPDAQLVQWWGALPDQMRRFAVARKDRAFQRFMRQAIKPKRKRT